MQEVASVGPIFVFLILIHPPPLRKKALISSPIFPSRDNSCERERLTVTMKRKEINDLDPAF